MVGELDFLFFKVTAESLPKEVAVGQIAHPDPCPRHLIDIGRTDPASGSPDLPALSEPLQFRVQDRMIGEHEMCVLADKEVLLDLHVQLTELVHFLDEGGQINHYAVPQDADLPFPQHARRDQMQDDLLLSHHDRMAGVGPTLVSGHRIEILREEINDLALPFVAPLRTDNDYIGHRRSPRSISPQNRSTGTRSSVPEARSLMNNSS